MTSTLRVEPRFCGPPGTGNGGYVAGRVASVLEGAVEVTLRAPTPLDCDLSLTRTEQGASLHSPEGVLLAEATSLTSLEVPLPPPLSFARAQQASARYVGFQHHPYPACFVCGPLRGAALAPGLALFPGAVELAEDAEQRVAAPFVPAPELCDEHGLLRAEYVWAALDCPSWFGYASFLERPPPTLLGRLALSIARRPGTRERCVVQGFALGREGRRIFCGAALFGADETCIAYSRATWVELKSA